MTIQMKSSVDRLHTAPPSFVKSSTHEILWDLFWVLWPFAKPISSSEQRRNTSTSCLYFEIKPAGSDEIRKLLNIVQTVSDRRSPNSFSFVGWLQEWDARRTVRGCCWQTFVLHSCTEANFAGAFTSNIIYLLSLYFDFLYLFPTINIWNIQPLQIFSGGFDWH